MPTIINAGQTALTITPDTTGALTLQANGTNALQITANGQITTANAPFILTGGRIQFPSTAVPSGDGNCLDDYEEGTWTPVNASIASITLTVTQARYVKVGRLVFVTCYVTYPSTADTNHAKIGGFPFTHADDNTYSYMSGRTLYNGSKEPVYWQVQTNLTEAAAYQSGAGNTVNNNDLSTGYVIFSGCYYAAA